MSGKVVTRGRAIVRAAPEEVEFIFEVRAAGQAPGAAMGAVSNRNNALFAVFTELGVPANDRRTLGLRVEPNAQSGFTAVARTLVSLKDFSLIGKLLQGATEKAQAAMQGPSWRISPDSPARLQVCEQAAREARNKAEAYARALGVTLAGVVAVEDSVRVETLDEDGDVLESGASGRLEIEANVTVEFALKG